MYTKTLSASSLRGTDVKNTKGENLGELKDLMIDVESGRVSYAVLSFGGFLGMGDKYFAIPLQKFSVDTEDEELILNVSKEQLENAPGFDKDNWPSSADREFHDEVYSYYEEEPYWKKESTF